MIPILATVLTFEALLDYCAYGEAWRKSTRVRSNRPWVTRLSKTCPGNHVHQVLRGSTKAHGKTVSWTSLASPYPILLVRHWAQVICSWWHQHKHRSRLSIGDQSHSLDVSVDLNTTGAGSSRLVPAHGTARYSHIDDHCVFGSDARVVSTDALELVHRLQEKGFIIGDSTPAGTVDRYVGYSSQVTPARWTIPTSKVVVIYEALGWFISLDVFSVAMLRAIVGVLNWTFLLRRSMLSIFYRVYEVVKM